MIKCDRCHKLLHTDIPRKIWLYAKGRKGIDDVDKSFTTITKNEVLIYLTTSGFPHNVWLCTSCYKDWGEFRDKVHKTWREQWKFWKILKEVVQFT
jgi:hypothetical protein